MKLEILFKETTRLFHIIYKHEILSLSNIRTSVQDDKCAFSRTDCVLSVLILE